MNLPLCTPLFTFAGIVFLAAGFSGCSHEEGTAHASMVADTVPGTSGRTGLAVEGGGMPKGIGRYGGHYYYIRNGTATRLVQRQRFTEGYSYDGKGRIIARDGSLVRLNEREMVTFGGEHLPTPPNVVFP
jgi:hypothetical protein